MSATVHVATPPAKPLMVFDGDCHFCSLWIQRWQQLTGSAVDYLPAQDPRVAEQFPEIPRAHFAAAVQLIATDGAVYAGAEAVFRALARNPAWRWPMAAYLSFPFFARSSERTYRLIAKHRPLFSQLTRWCWGNRVEGPDYRLVRWCFLRALGLIYFAAFFSLGFQIKGLIGHNGILPADQFISMATQQCDWRGIGLERFHLLPTLCWFDSSDAFLKFQCAAGTVLSAGLIAGVAPVPTLALLWLFYLSLVAAGRDFLGFQWDALLLETGCLAIFLAPLQWLPRPSREFPPSRLVIWLLRLLLFKLMFSSGCVKLLSGDPNWRNLTALTFHYQTQPLPPWTAWYASQAQLWLQKASCAFILAIELGAPFLIFAPRRLRFIGAAFFTTLQVLIMATGNYAFFNWLTLALCLMLLDDHFLARVLPAGWNITPRGEATGLRWPRPLLMVVAALMLATSGFILAATLGWRTPLLTPLAWVTEQLAPFRSANNYGLFAVMTTQRNEIIVEGSNDGVNWLPYEFKYKPGDLKRRPAFVAPFQPRLDWQMWFAALGSYQQNPWFEHFCRRLLEGSPDVLALLAKNPFPDSPPRFVRAELYNYQFTDFATRRATGNWWKREFSGEYMPPVSLGKTGTETPGY